MNRVLKIVSIAVVLFLAYMWLSVLAKSCNKSKEIEFPNQKDETLKKDDEFSSEDFFDENDTLKVQDQKSKETINYKEIDQTIKENTSASQSAEKINAETKPSITPLSNVESNSKSTIKPIKKEIVEKKIVTPIKKEDKKPEVDKEAATSKTGKYVVIAGNYLVEGNADVMVKKLKKAGFVAEKVVFNLSEFHTVIVGRYAENGSASKTVSNLKVKGFDAYVHKPK